MLNKTQEEITARWKNKDTNYPLASISTDKIADIIKECNDVAIKNRENFFGKNLSK